MKKYYQIIKSIGAIAILVAIVTIVNYVTAAGNYQPVPQPTSYPSHPSLLFTNNTAQAKQGNLALGALATGYTPQSTLDVKGSVVTDLLGILNGAVVTQQFKVGGLSAPNGSGSQLQVEGSRIRSEILAGTGERTICADADGRLKICNVPPPPTLLNGVCGAADGLSVSSAPTSGLCTSGTASAVTGAGPWTWTCNGSNGGSNDSCSAPVSATPPAPINGVCNMNAPGTCSSGTPTAITTITNPVPSGVVQGSIGARRDRWSCLGSDPNSTSDDMLNCTSSYYCPVNYSQGCFTAGTLVTMQDGSKRAIETIAEGERVFAAGDATNQVQEVLVHSYSGWVYGINGSDPFVTGMHPMMTTQGWKAFEPEKTSVAEPDVKIVGKLKVGDTLLKEDGVKEKIKEVTREWKTIPVYNLNVSGTNEYYADGYQVHNKNTPPYCAPVSNPDPVQGQSFCESYNLAANCTIQQAPGCNGISPTCHAYVCSGVSSNSIINLSNPPASWTGDTTGIYYVAGGNTYDGAIPGPTSGNTVTVVCTRTPW